ncbi:MAG: hypothetical protein KJ950_09905 [Proteobacteria bacterium]|nr:hypothetical protein [Pseudomonadota bacterium]MBU1688969.1 hypothetical protein [Pseudomonadota bacterium]
MKRFFLIFALALLCGPSFGATQSITLAPGESFSQDGLTVECIDSPRLLTPLVTSQCSLWDEFGKTCLYRAQTYSVGPLKCVEECQHWDDFGKTCRYVTTCRYNSEHGIFIQASCEKYDSFAGICLSTREFRIPPN